LINYCIGSELKLTVEMKTDVILREKIKVKCERSDTRNNQKQWRTSHIPYYPL